jgi:hypothetical protein
MLEDQEINNNLPRNSILYACWKQRKIAEVAETRM